MRGVIPQEAKDFLPVQRWRNNEHRNLPMAEKTFAHLLSLSSFPDGCNFVIYVHSGLPQSLCKRLYACHIADADRMHAGIDAPNQAREHILGTNFDKLCDALCDDVLDAFDPLHRVG